MHGTYEVARLRDAIRGLYWALGIANTSKGFHDSGHTGQVGITAALPAGAAS